MPSHIIKSTKKLTEKSTQKLLTDEISRKLLEHKSNENHSVKCVMLENKYRHYYKTGELIAWDTENTDIISSKKITMANKIIRDKSRCANCMSYKSSFLNQKQKKVVVNINPKHFIY